MVGVDLVVSAVGFSKATDAEFDALMAGLELILAQTSVEESTTQVRQPVSAKDRSSSDIRLSFRWPCTPPIRKARSSIRSRRV